MLISPFSYQLGDLPAAMDQASRVKSVARLGISDTQRA
jgi:hypothetical protein